MVIEVELAIKLSNIPQLHRQFSKIYANYFYNT